VEDVVEANLIAMGQDAQGVFNVGTGIETPINELFQIVVELTKSATKEVHGPAKKGEQARSVINAAKLRHELGWESKVDLREGLRRTVAYFHERMA